jgi:hypothetical protein
MTKRAVIFVPILEKNAGIGESNKKAALQDITSFVATTYSSSWTAHQLS